LWSEDGAKDVAVIIMAYSSFMCPLDGVPMVACRVCQNMIDISGKKDQVWPENIIVDLHE
jgi:hypothetical protein